MSIWNEEGVEMKWAAWFVDVAGFIMGLIAVGAAVWFGGWVLVPMVAGMVVAFLSGSAATFLDITKHKEDEGP